MSVERLTTSEVARKLLERPAPNSGRARFAVRQVKGVGGQTVIEWEVDVPVCDEYPTASEAWAAAHDFAKAFVEEYGQQDDLEDKLRESVRVVKQADPARKAAAIAAATVKAAK